jgi:predicted nuclease of predicted toxin-antitoxin system
MQIKVDEDLPKRVVALLRENGYEADSVVEQAMAGWKDVELWRSIHLVK